MVTSLPSWYASCHAPRVGARQIGKGKAMDTQGMKATCGHDDILGYFIGTPCHECTVKAYEKAIGGKR